MNEKNVGDKITHESNIKKSIQKLEFDESNKQRKTFSNFIIRIFYPKSLTYFAQAYITYTEIKYNRFIGR